MESLKDKTAKGLFWGAINSGSSQVLNLVFGIFLGRLLSPDDYGIVGMLTIFTAIAGNLQDSGFSTALVNRKNITAADYNAVFWFNILTGLAMYAVLFCAAPFIASYFHQPVLVPLSRFVFLSFVIASLGIAHGAYMIRNLMNKEKAIIGFVALVGSGVVGVALAFLGFRYWSLAWQQVVFILLLNFGRLYYVKWRPSFKISFKPIREMFAFSNKILITTIVNTLSQNILTVIFGRLFPAKAVGNFTQAFKWSTMANAFVANTVAQVAQPVFARLNDEEDRQLRAFRKMLRFTAFMVFPAMFGFALVAPEFIVITISNKWADSIPLLQILCLGAAFMPIYTVYQNLVVGKGRSDIYMWCNVFQIIFQIGLILLVHRMGIVAMVTAYSAFTVLWLLVWQWFAHRLIGVRLFEALKDVLPFMLIAGAAMAVAYFAAKPFSAAWLSMGVKVVVAAILYLGTMKLSHAKIMDECLSYLKKKRG